MELVVAYGGGVDSVAMLIALRDREEVPRAIVMADPGSEWPETYTYRDEVVRPWCGRNGFPDITVVTLAEEAQYRPRAHATPRGTLIDECRSIRSLPSIAYGWKKCSQKYKARPFLWWCERQPWATDSWVRGERIVRAIGYELGEERRAREQFADPAEARRYVPRYPLIESRLDRDACVALIEREGLLAPHKSACTFCPSNQLAEWRELRDTHPERFEEALALEANAEITTPDVVGLLRVAPHGKRQLRMLDQVTSEREQDVPCECGT
jgi:hypothetical protein